MPPEELTEGDPDYPWLPMEFGFRRERDAYAHLIRAGTCAKGVVPNCYGWLALTPHHIEKILTLSDDQLAPSGKRLFYWKDLAPHALLLEYFPTAVPVSIDNVTEKIADVAVRAMCDIHAAHVLHDDIHPRNILVFPGEPERVVWVDFNSARVPCKEPKMSRQHLVEEAAAAWGCFYSDLVRFLIMMLRPNT